MDIKIIKENKKRFSDLLLLADEQEKFVGNTEVLKYRRGNIRY